MQQNTLSLEYIFDKILLDLKKKRKIITSKEIEVVISSYTHMKKYLSFDLDKVEPGKPLVEKMFGLTFYIYDDFHSNIDYFKYNHIEIDLPDNSGHFRVDYYCKDK